MQYKETIRIQLLDIEQMEDKIIQQLCRIINTAYEEGEKGMWQGNIPRTNPTEIQEFISNKQIIGAFLGSQIVGSVFIKRMPDGITGEFGMLAVDKKQKGHGIGGKLIQAAENWAIQNNLAQMRLELLTPQDWQHPVKDFLKKWYRKLGYIPQHKESFDRMYPVLAKQLQTPCNFTVWINPLNK